MRSILSQLSQTVLKAFDIIFNKVILLHTSDNPADMLSRGAFPSDFVNRTTWIHRPSWLSEKEHSWPNSITITSEIPEQRITINLKIERSFELLQQYSSIVTLRRVVARCCGKIY
ncbi:hypothetical protein P5V15_014916 [Pogonomyrmex californicus]